MAKRSSGSGLDGLNQPAQSQKSQGKKAKGSPKLKRAGRANTKARYVRQVDRTEYNKLRRIIRSNGDAAASVRAGSHQSTAILTRARREFAETRKRRGLA